MPQPSKENQIRYKAKWQRIQLLLSFWSTERSWTSFGAILANQSKPRHNRVLVIHRYEQKDRGRLFNNEGTITSVEVEVSLCSSSSFRSLSPVFISGDSASLWSRLSFLRSPASSWCSTWQQFRDCPDVDVEIMMPSISLRTTFQSLCFACL